MLGNNLGNEVVQLIDEWIPEDKHENEYGFQQELEGYLDIQLNEKSNSGMHPGLGGGTGGEVPVWRERGKSDADLVVDDSIGIEMKKDLKNRDINRLRGQIEKYKKEFPVVIAVACGISDMSGWRELQNDYQGMGAVGMSQSEVHFIHKKKDNFGKDPSEINRDNSGPFGGGGLI
ncbi:hypothetical protein [Halorientalis marina]|uniref:hypothetical protein n=1 Tax=Halorientalis marina TaxID=2931976 RepID=UPI001FF1E672|nr:hypothetical protein [Halorientalis marina]